jgi:hypothetical protein
MEGIQFVTNDKGEKVAVLIDLARHGEIWEDIYDQLLAEERANDKRLPYATVRPFEILTPHPGSIIGEADDLVHTDWSQEWKPDLP